MIKASKFSLNAGSQLADSIGQFKIPPESEQKHEKKWFLSGDMTMYGHKDVRMSKEGYDIVKDSILNNKNSLQLSDPLGPYKARKALAQHLSASDLQLEYQDVYLTHGANIGLLHSILALSKENDNILVPEPSYPFYHKTTKGLNVQLRPYKLLPESKWEIDLEYLQTLIDENTRFIWVVNPSNPCGSVFSKQHLENILKVAKKHNKLVISDEVYYNETFENVQFTSMGHVNNNEFSCIVIGGMEKTFCVPGWSCSWISFYDKHGYLDDVRKAIQNSCNMINSPPEFVSQGLDIILEKLTLNFTKKLMPIFEKSFNYCYEKISKINGLVPIKAQGTFYLSALIELEKFKEFKSDIDFLQALLNEYNIFILSLSCFGGGVNGFRLMSAAPIEFYDGMFEKLDEFTKKHLK